VADDAMATCPTLERSETATSLRLRPWTERRPLVCPERTAALSREAGTSDRMHPFRVHCRTGELASAWTSAQGRRR